MSSLVVIGTGCAPTDDPGACEIAMDGVTPIESVDGLYLLVSDELASTSRSCETVGQWIAVFRAHPEIVDQPVLSEDDARAYLGEVCAHPESGGADNAVCAQARREGISQ